MVNKYILGGGISGLIAKYFNPEFEIITPDIGGQLKANKNLLITFFIHNHPETKKLLNELKVPFKERRIKIFYYHNGEICENISDDLRIRFIKNKMCEYDYDSNSYNVADLSLSSKTNYLDILDTDINLIIEKLKPEKVIIGRVKLVNNNRKFLVYSDNENKLIKADYEKLISTLSANEFFNMLYNYQDNYNFNYLPATFVLSSHRPDFMFEDGMYYICDSNLIYNRVQPYSDNYIYEITGFPSDDEIKNKIPKVIDIERRYSGIIKSINIDDFKHIKFLGRAAQWNHGVKTQEVIIKAKKISEDLKNGK